MLIDCDTCAARGPACGDCVVTVLLGAPSTVAGDGSDALRPVELDGAERAALAVLAGSGLVPPLRLLPGTPDSATARDADRQGTPVARDRDDRPAGHRRAAG